MQFRTHDLAMNFYSTYLLQNKNFKLPRLGFEHGISCLKDNRSFNQTIGSNIHKKLILAAYTFTKHPINVHSCDRTKSLANTKLTCK